jgi:hypothetical protein
MLKRSFLVLLASLSIGLSSYSPPANGMIMLTVLNNFPIFGLWGFWIMGGGWAMMHARSVGLFFLGLDEAQAGATINEMASQLGQHYGLNDMDSENVAVLVYNETVKAASAAQQGQSQIAVKISVDQIKEVVSAEAQQTAGFEQLITDFTK